MTLIGDKFAKRAGPTLSYLKARTFTNDLLNRQLAWMTDNQAAGEDGAKHFLRNNEADWMAWVPADVGQKIKSALH